MSAALGNTCNLKFDFVPQTQHAKVDTGAETCSVHATDMREKNGILQCKILNHMHTFETYTTKQVKSSNGESSTRYCVTLPFRMHDKPYECEFTLNDRSSMQYPILLGKNFLSANEFMVDVNKTVAMEHKRILLKSLLK